MKEMSGVRNSCVSIYSGKQLIINVLFIHPFIFMMNLEYNTIMLRSHPSFIRANQQETIIEVSFRRSMYF